MRLLMLMLSTQPPMVLRLQVRLVPVQATRVEMCPFLLLVPVVVEAVVVVDPVVVAEVVVAGVAPVVVRWVDAPVAVALAAIGPPMVLVPKTVMQLAVPLAVVALRQELLTNLTQVLQTLPRLRKPVPRLRKRTLVGPLRERVWQRPVCHTSIFPTVPGTAHTRIGESEQTHLQDTVHRWTGLLCPTQLSLMGFW